jgi:DNA-binding CsgD family transcriptional regulator
MCSVASFDAPVSSLIDLIGSEQFSTQFFKTVDSLVPMDQCTVFVSERDTMSHLVAQAHGVAAHKVETLARSYVLNGHRRDPIWQNSMDGGSGRPMVVAPSSLNDLAYRREFYDSVNIFEEVALCSEIGGRRIYVAYYREREKGHFLDSEIELLAACGRSVLSVLNKQAEIAQRLGRPGARPRQLSRDELLKKVNQAILEDAPQLTAREAEICAGIILGYTIFGLSLNCGISVNTVATHRKRAYAKLKISSQNELFAHYFGVVERLNQ